MKSVNRISSFLDNRDCSLPQLAINRNRITGMIAGRRIRVIPRLEQAIPEKLVSVLREHGIKAKIFALHSSRKQEFDVRGREHDWEVMPLVKSGVKIPAKARRSIAFLGSLGICIERFYIAKAKDYALARLLMSEASMQGKILAEEAAYAAIGMIAGFEEAVRAIQEARKKRQNPVSMIPKYLPDPVLLVKLPGHNKLIEVARWV